MHICIPVTEDRGLQSPICMHYGSAPYFVLVDTETGTCRSILNSAHHHEPGSCHALALFDHAHVDAAIVGGIGAGALNQLRATGIQVFLSNLPTVEAAIAALNNGSLPEAIPEKACAGHMYPSCGHNPHTHG